jgi:asparagine synthase (glutamine-hydrolysing)
MSPVGGVVRPHGDTPVSRRDEIALLRSLSSVSYYGASLWEARGTALIQGIFMADPARRHPRAPVRSPDETVCVVADARLDNREYLLSALPRWSIRRVRSGRAPVPRDDLPSDAELIMAAYLRWGVEAPSHLLGDFAFALWDERDGTLLCARDPFGVKPFYYHLAPDGSLAFASRLQCILDLGWFPREVDDEALGDFLMRHFEDRSRTPYRRLSALPPAHTLSWDRRGRTTLQRYWELDPGLEVRFHRDEDYAEAFREALLDAVRCRMPSQGAVGSMLSGGLDSSSVTCAAEALAREADTGPVHTFSQIYDVSTQCDERGYMEAVLHGRELTPHWIQADAVSPLEPVADLVRELGRPSYAENLVLTRASLRSAAGSARVVLDGLHGDNTVSYGELHLADLLRAGRWVQAGRLLRGHRAHSPGRGWQTLRRYGIRPLTPSEAIRAWTALRRRSTPSVPGPLIDPAFAERSGVLERIAQRNRDLWSAPVTAQRLHYLDLTAGITVAALESADALAAASGIEVRFPFLDRRLVELCYGMPPEQKFFNGRPRALIRRGMADLLPEAVSSRRDKRGTGAWFARWLAGPERSRLEAWVREASSALEGYVDPVRLRAAHRRFLTTGRYADARLLWEPLVLWTWLVQERPQRSNDHQVLAPPNTGGAPTHKPRRLRASAPAVGSPGRSPTSTARHTGACTT